MAVLERITVEPRPEPAAAATPDAIPPQARRRAAAPRQVLGAIAVGSLMLGLLAASDLPSWGEDLGEGALTPVLRQAANAWSGEMDRLGLSAPHEALRAAVRWLRDRQWP